MDEDAEELGRADGNTTSGRDILKGKFSQPDWEI